MFSTHGRRFLTDAQVERIMQWRRDRKTLGQVARENGVSRGTIELVIRNGVHYKNSLPLTTMELRRVLDCQRNRKTLSQVARQYGDSIETIQNVIRARGRYKRAPPLAPSISSPEVKRRAGRGR